MGQPGTTVDTVQSTELETDLDTGLRWQLTRILDKTKTIDERLKLINEEISSAMDFADSIQNYIDRQSKEGKDTVELNEYFQKQQKAVAELRNEQQVLEERLAVLEPEIVAGVQRLINAQEAALTKFALIPILAAQVA